MIRPELPSSRSTWNAAAGSPGPEHGAPPPGAPGWPGYPVGEVDAGRNGFSIAGLVLGIIPVTAGVLGIVFGLIGRSQSKRRGQKGRVMGTVGAVLGATWLTITVVLAVRDHLGAARRGDNGELVKPGHESAFSLRVGDCLRSVPSDLSEVTEVDLVSCAHAHKAEVYANIRLTYTSFPGSSVISKRSEASCKKAFEPFVGLDYNDSTLDVYFLYPSARSWRLAADRTATCLVSGAHLVGSARGSRR